MSLIGTGLNCSVASIVGVAPAPGSDWSSLDRLQRQTELGPSQPCYLRLCQGRTPCPGTTAGTTANSPD
jgi:hypothetical protein